MCPVTDELSYAFVGVTDNFVDLAVNCAVLDVNCVVLADSFVVIVSSCCICEQDISANDVGVGKIMLFVYISFSCIFL